MNMRCAERRRGGGGVAPTLMRVVWRVSGANAGAVRRGSCGMVPMPTRSGALACCVVLCAMPTRSAEGDAWPVVSASIKQSTMSMTEIAERRGGPIAGDGPDEERRHGGIGKEDEAIGAAHVTTA